MRSYIIGSDGIALCREAPAALNDGEIVVAAKDELHAAPLSGTRLLTLWNALPGVDKRRKVGDRENTRARSVAAPLRRPWSRSVVVEVIASSRRDCGNLFRSLTGSTCPARTSHSRPLADVSVARILYSDGHSKETASTWVHEGLAQTPGDHSCARPRRSGFERGRRVESRRRSRWAHSPQPGR